MSCLSIRGTRFFDNVGSTKEEPNVEVDEIFLAVGTNIDPPADAMTLLIVFGNDQHQGKWVALLERKGSERVQVIEKTISKYYFFFLNSGDEVVLGQVENTAYIFQLLLDELTVKSPSDVGTNVGRRELLNIENQPSDAASGPISLMDERRSRDDNDPTDIL
ncbi:hypothetical protein BC332_19067 [Capsicum chinense]|nr:hypothetical protein BC332_19067 [Capsicum chinense]